MDPSVDSGRKDGKELQAHDSIEEAVKNYAESQPANDNAVSEKTKAFQDAKLKEYVQKQRDQRAEKDAIEASVVRQQIVGGEDMTVVTPEDKAAFAGIAKKEADARKAAEFEEMNQKRIAALRQEVQVLGDALKMRGIDMEAQSAKGLMGRMMGGIRRAFNGDVRQYESKLALLNKLVEQDEDSKRSASDWNKRATRAVLGPGRH